MLEAEIFPISKEEIALVKFIRTLAYGNLEITVQDRKPVMVKQAIKNIKL